MKPQQGYRNLKNIGWDKNINVVGAIYPPNWNRAYMYVSTKIWWELHSPHVTISPGGPASWSLAKRTTTKSCPILSLYEVFRVGNLSWWWCEKGNLKFNQIYFPRRIMYVIVALYFKSFVKRKNPTELSNTKIIYNLTCFVEINSTSYVEFNVGSQWDFPEILSIILFFLSFNLYFFLIFFCLFCFSSQRSQPELAESVDAE